MTCPWCGREPKPGPLRRGALFPFGYWHQAEIGKHAYPGTLPGMYVRVSKLRKQFPDREFKAMKSKEGFFIVRLK